MKQEENKANSYFDDIGKAFDNGYRIGYDDAGTLADTVLVDGCKCVSNAKVFGLNDSIRRAKFPMSVDTDSIKKDLTDGIKALAQSGLGEGHDQWLTGVIVQFDLTFTNKGWIEMERYHFVDFVSSQSTMHRITKFNLETAYDTDYVDNRIVEIMREKVEDYKATTDKAARKQKYLEILYSNPAGFRLTAGLTTNYRQLKTIYRQRKDHRLPEWREFCKWIESLPHSELITE